jgi:hypothetical protein
MLAHPDSGHRTQRSPTAVRSVRSVNAKGATRLGSADVVR